MYAISLIFLIMPEEEVTSLLQRRPEVNALDDDIKRLRMRHEKSGLPHDMVALLAQVPRTVWRSCKWIRFEHGYRNKQERLYELIDFNDTLVSTILLMNDDLRRQFAGPHQAGC